MSRDTGEIAPSIHLEWRTNGVKAVRSLGISSAQDLLHFDFRELWAYRLTLLRASPGRAGRLVRNQSNGMKSRIDTEADLRVGIALFEDCETVQESSTDGEAYILSIGSWNNFRIAYGCPSLPNPYLDDPALAYEAKERARCQSDTLAAVEARLIMDIIILHLGLG